MYYLLDWGHQGDLILLLLHSTDQPLHRLTLPSGRQWSLLRRWTGRRLLTLGRCSNLKLLAGTESKTFHFRLVGTVITGMVDPNVPSFWPHNEVHFHLSFSSVIHELSCLDTALFQSFLVVLNIHPLLLLVFRPGSHTRPGWRLLRMRSIRNT